MEAPLNILGRYHKIEENVSYISLGYPGYSFYLAPLIRGRRQLRDISVMCPMSHNIVPVCIIKLLKGHI